MRGTVSEVVYSLYELNSTVFIFMMVSYLTEPETLHLIGLWR